MKRGTGLLALFAFLLTGIHFATGPAGVRGTSEVKAAGATGVPSGLATREDTTCESFEYADSQNGKTQNTTQPAIENSEIARLVDRFLYGAGQSSRLSPGGLPEGIRLMMVTVPDPGHTHLSLQFDRSLEAVQQAAQDEGYTYDSSWLPWRTVHIEYSNVADREVEMREAARREVCPGVILFRRTMTLHDRCKDSAGNAPRSGDVPYQCGMVVFVVGEQPTSGLNRIQWDNALHWIDRYASRTRPDKALRILGPTFSGSMPSYVRALEVTGMYSGTFTSTLLYSGRIRGCASWRWLKHELNSRPISGAPAPTSVKLPVRLADFQENDAIQTDRLFRYLWDRGHRLSEIAVMSEDETEYGGLPDYRHTEPDDREPAAEVRAPESEAPEGEGSCNPEDHRSDRPVHLYYPHDISAIRSAYQEQSMFSSPSNSDASQPHVVLRESDSNTREGTDTIEPFSGNSLALTQEAQLYGIVNTLKTHGIRFIILRSTNSLDYLFLTRFLHRAYPTAYIITMGSDLLFGREVDSTEFRGVMALSSFPLLPRGQDWTLQTEAVGQHAHRVFGNYTMEGLYLASRFLITDPDVKQRETIAYQHPAKADIPDYTLPFWEEDGRPVSEPATWLSVIGRDGYWPIATLTETMPKQNSSRPLFSNQALVEKPLEPATHRGEAPRPQHLSLSGSWRFFCVLALLAFGMHYFACRYGWDRQELGMFVQFTRLHGRRGPALMAAGWAAICCLLLILFMTTARIYHWLDTADRVWVLIMGGATGLACLLAIVELRWWVERPAAAAPKASDDSRTATNERLKGRTEASRHKIGNGERIKRSQLRFYPFLIALMLGVIVLFGAAVWQMFEFGRTNESGVTTAYRSVHLTSGVSPVVSFIALLAGLYWWFWHSLSGLALVGGDGRPILPRGKNERRSVNLLAERIERVALPFPRFGKSTLLLYLLPVFLVLLLAIVLQRAWMQPFDLVLHTMENTAFNDTLRVLIGIGLYLILLESIQFYSTWLVLKRLLARLDRLPLRRTFAALQGLSMRSLWRLSGSSSRARYKTFTRQMDSLVHLRNELDTPEGLSCGSIALRKAVRATSETGSEYIGRRDEGRDFAVANDAKDGAIRIAFRACAELIMDDLLTPQWQDEGSSLEAPESSAEGETRPRITLSDNKAVRVGEEFLCLIYVGYLQNLLGRMRTMVLSVAGVFAAIALSVGFYPYTPRPTISLSLLILLLMIGTMVGVVFAGLDRDSTLSHITNTEPGALGAHFWLRMVSFIGVPALGLIVAQFPEITDFVFSWIAPTMSAVK